MFVTQDIIGIPGMAMLVKQSKVLAVLTPAIRLVEITSLVIPRLVIQTK